MPAVELVNTRVVYSEDAFAELVLWALPKALAGSAHRYKYRLAYVVRGVCVVRYDNEAGKGVLELPVDPPTVRATERPHSLLDGLDDRLG